MNKATRDIICNVMFSINKSIEKRQIEVHITIYANQLLGLNFKTWPIAGWIRWATTSRETPPANITGDWWVTSEVTSRTLKRSARAACLSSASSTTWSSWARSTVDPRMHPCHTGFGTSLSSRSNSVQQWRPTIFTNNTNNNCINNNNNMYLLKGKQTFRYTRKLDFNNFFYAPLQQILDSIVVSIPACHAGDRGSIPRRGEIYFT